MLRKFPSTFPQKSEMRCFRLRNGRKRPSRRATRCEASKASITGVYPVNGLRKTDYFGYFQDEFKWRQNFTLNLGVRYSGLRYIQ